MLRISPVVMLWISPVVALWISSGRSCSSWLLNWLLGLYGQELMTVEQHISLADVILGLPVAMNVVQVMTKVFFLLELID